MIAYLFVFLYFLGFLTMYVTTFFFYACEYKDRDSVFIHEVLEVGCAVILASTLWPFFLGKILYDRKKMREGLSEEI